MKRLIDKLKARWSVESAVQLAIILVVFALTGMTILLIKPLVMQAVFGAPKPSGWLSLVYYLFSPLIYNALLLFYGALLGQFRFFWAFEKRLLQRLSARLSRLPKEDPPTHNT